MNLLNKVVLITGAESGSGKAIARECVKQGAWVMIHGLDENLCQALVNELGSGKASYVVADFADSRSARHIVDKTLREFGRLDCVVNNAATMQRGNLQNLTNESLHYIYAINAVAPALIIQTAVAYAQERMEKLPYDEKPGLSIVQIGSNNAYVSGINLIEYGMSKAALMNLTQSLGTDKLLIREKIRINQLNIGWMLSENENALIQKEAKVPANWSKRLPTDIAPTGKLISPEQVAKQVVYYLSDDSAPATGLVIPFDQQTMMQAISNVAGVGLFNKLQTCPLEKNKTNQQQIRAKL